MRAVVRRIIRLARTRAADMNARAPRTKGLRDAVADAAGATDHQHLLAAEIELVHRARLPNFRRMILIGKPVPTLRYAALRVRIMHVLFDLSADRCQPCQPVRSTIFRHASIPWPKSKNSPAR